MFYKDKGIHLTDTNFPICYLDQKACWVSYCRYYLQFKKIGNCVLRMDNPKGVTFEVLSRAMKISRQRVDQIEKRAIRKIGKQYGEEIRKALGL